MDSFPVALAKPGHRFWAQVAPQLATPGEHALRLLETLKDVLFYTAYQNQSYLESSELII